MTGVLPFTRVTGRVVPLMFPNVDTDVIIRIERMNSVAADQLGRYALEALRYRADGSLDPECVFNQPRYQAAPILVAAANFGCGSSREAAVWALQGLGIRAVIAPSFGDIFSANCFQNGVLALRLPPADVEALAAQGAIDGATATVDLVDCVVTAPDGRRCPFDVDPQKRESLLQGLDDIDLTLQHDAAIRAWQAADRIRRPWAWDVAASLPRRRGQA